MVKASFGAVLFVAIAVSAAAQTALVQFAHNSADPSITAVDIWLNDQIVVDDLYFRTATEFLSVPANVEVRLSIAPSTSTSLDDTISTTTFTLVIGSRTCLITAGVSDPGTFFQNPAGKDLSLRFIAVQNVAESSPPGTVGLYLVAGVTDAPTVDFKASGLAPATNMNFGDVSPPQTATTGTYTVSAAPSGAPPLVAYQVRLDSFDARTCLLITSGFLLPAANQGGASYGMFVIPPDGGRFLAMPVTGVPEAAQVQFIHNAADPTLATVDVYVNGVLAQDNFTFRLASRFIDVPAGTNVIVAIAPQSSSSASEAVKTFTLQFEVGRYVVVLNGLADTSAFAPNPDARAHSLQLSAIVLDGIRQLAVSPSEVDIRYFHGCTDAPAIDVYHNDVREVRDLVYGSAGDYASLEASLHTIAVAPTASSPIITVPVNLAPLTGQAIVVLASGFVVPTANNNGQPLGLWVALERGGPLVPLQSITSVDDAARSAVPVLWPNPASYQVMVGGFDMECVPTTIELFDPTGRVVVSQPIEGTQSRMILDVGNCATGLYTVRVHVDGRVSTAPLIITR